MESNHDTITKGQLNECCQNKDNLEIISYEQGVQRKVISSTGAEQTIPAHLTIRQCKVCQRKHYEMEADAGHLGVLFN